MVILNCQLIHNFKYYFTLHLDYCLWEKFNATCTSNNVIVMMEAKYGRMRDSRCAQNNDGYIGCQKVNMNSFIHIYTFNKFHFTF